MCQKVLVLQRKPHRDLWRHNRRRRPASPCVGGGMRGRHGSAEGTGFRPRTPSEIRVVMMGRLERRTTDGRWHAAGATRRSGPISGGASSAEPRHSGRGRIHRGDAKTRRGDLEGKRKEITRPKSILKNVSTQGVSKYRSSIEYTTITNTFCIVS